MRFSVSAVLAAACLFFATTMVVATDVVTAADTIQVVSDAPVLLPSQSAPRIDPAALAQDNGLSLGTEAPKFIVAPAVEVSAAPATSLAALVSREDDDVAALDDETRCLASAVFYEARSESLAGQLAVARVVINRAHSGRFAGSLCGVVKQRGQFSFVHGGEIPAVADGSRQWPSAVAIARIAQADMWKSNAEGALYFHARHIAPSRNRVVLAQIENHIFYR